MLQFILGRSGFGKTEYLRRRFAELARNGEDKLLFIVPDQISFETETAFLDLLGPAVSQRIRVLGFSRLCDHVFETTGSRFSAFADDGVRHMVMSLALEETAGSLEVFDRRADTADTREIMLSAIKEYKKCSIGIDDLFAAAENVPGDTLRKKLCDTAKVYAAYDAIMAGSYMDPLDSLTKAAQLLEEDPLFDGYTIALDSFYGFTAQEYEVIERLMAMCGDMYVALTDDGEVEGDPLFFVPRRTRIRLSRTARSLGVEIVPYLILEKPKRFACDELKALEANIFRITKAAYTAPSDKVEVYRASGIYDECDYVARTIRELAEGGMRYRDIAVIARNTDNYTGIIDVCFDKYDIHYFMDKPQNIDSMPIVRLVNSVFAAVTHGYERESVLGLLKTGLCGYSADRIADFENYLFVWDISGKRFFDPFTDPPGGFADEMSDSDKKQLAQIESLRAEVIGKLRKFSDSVRDADGRRIASALMILLYDLKCDKNILKQCERLERDGEPELAADLIRMWNELCGILDKTVAVLGDRKLSPKRFSELLYTDFAVSQVGNIPRGLDEVDISTADRSLVSDKKAIFLIGAVEGEFPHAPVEAGVFTDGERELLKHTLDLPLSDSIVELLATEKYYAYSAVTAAGERLYVSYPAADMRSAQLNPSELISEIELCLPERRFRNFDEIKPEERLRSKRAAFDYLVSRYREHSADIAALKEYFRNDGEYRDIIASIDGALEGRQRRIADPDLPRELFGGQMGLSSTKIDVYHKCAFRYFCEYGLRVKERRRAAVDALEYGTLMHHIFERFFGERSREEYLSMDERRVAESVGEIVDEYIEKHFGGLENKTGRFVYLLTRVKNTATRLILHMLDELRQSDFVPIDFELGVGEDIPAYTAELGGGLSLTVRGSIDRVDVCDDDGERYIRVVDYKTGTKEFNVGDLLYGLNLQMFLYLYAIKLGGGERYGEITPAGVLYMPAVSPSVTADPDTPEEKIRAEILGKYAMKGVILNDVNVVGHMEHDGKGTFIPARIKDGTVAASAGSLATLEEIGAIFRRIDLLIADMAKSLYSGDVDALPLKGDKYDGCAFCPYRAVCLHDDDGPCREAQKMSAQQVFDELTREEDNDAGLEQ